MERSYDLRAGEWFWDEQDSSGVPGTEAGVGHLRCVTDDDHGKLAMIRMMTQGVEECFAHGIGGTIQHERIGDVLPNQFVDGSRASLCEDLVAGVPQRNRQKLGDLPCVVDEQDAAQGYATSCRLRRPAAEASWRRRAPDP